MELETYAYHFNKRELQDPEFYSGDWVILNNPFAMQKREAEKAATESLKKLAVKKYVLYLFINESDHTLSVVIQGIYSLVWIDNFTLTRTNEKRKRLLVSHKQE